MPTFPGFASQLGGPIVGTRPSPPMNVGGYYQNEYGTDIRGGYDPINNRANVSAEFPIGASQQGYYGGVSGGWNPEQGFSAGVKFGKKRNPSPQTEDKYTYGFGLNQEPPMRFAGQMLPSYGQVASPAGVPNYGQPVNPVGITKGPEQQFGGFASNFPRQEF